MPELAKKQLDAMRAVKSILVDVTGYGRMHTVPDVVARRKHGCTGGSACWPDEVLVAIVRNEVLNPSEAIVYDVKAGPGEMTAFGKQYEDLSPDTDSKYANISVTGPGSAYGMILRELLRRMEEAIAADARQMERCGLMLPEAPT